MATININLLPEELQPSKRGGGGGMGGMPAMDRSSTIQIGAGVVVAALLAATPTLAQTFYFDPWQAEVDQKKADAQAEIDKYTSTLSEMKNLTERRDTLRKQLATLESVSGRSASWGDILDELRQLTPGNLWFENFKAESEKGEVTISGGALDYGSVAYFHRNLEHSEFFANPVLTKTETATGTVPIVKYDMKVTVRLGGKSGGK